VIDGRGCSRRATGIDVVERAVKLGISPARS